MSSPIQPAKDNDRDTLSMYAPSRKRNKPPVVDPPLKQAPQGRVVHAGGSPFSGLAGEDLRPRRSLTPEIVPEPKFLQSERPARALIALRLSGATAIATLIAFSTSRPGALVWSRIVNAAPCKNGGNSVAGFVVVAYIRTGPSAESGVSVTKRASRSATYDLAASSEACEASSLFNVETVNAVAGSASSKANTYPKNPGIASDAGRSRAITSG